MSRCVAFVLTALALVFGAVACGAGTAVVPQGDASTASTAGVPQGRTSTNCGINGCSITFPQIVDVAVSVLGVEARLAGVQNGNVELLVAGQRVTLPAGGQTEVAGFTVGVERVTGTEIVVRISP